LIHLETSADSSAASLVPRWDACLIFLCISVHNTHTNKSRDRVSTRVFLILWKVVLYSFLCKNRMKASDQCAGFKNRSQVWCLWAGPSWLPAVPPHLPPTAAGRALQSPPGECAHHAGTACQPAFVMSRAALGLNSEMNNILGLPKPSRLASDFISHCFLIAIKMRMHRCFFRFKERWGIACCGKGFVCVCVCSFPRVLR
jgi:hypothetical protein